MAYDTTDAEVHRVRSEVRRFKEHVLVYVAVLVLANLVAGGMWYAHFWLFWIALIWGVLIALQGIRLFGHDIGRDWEDRMVSHVMAARRNEPRPPPRQPGSPRSQPSPPPRPPTPAWPPSSTQNPPQPSAQAPIVTPAPPHTAIVPAEPHTAVLVVDDVPPAPQPEPPSSQEPLITPPPEPPKEPGA
jgi:2TM domain